MPFLGNFLRAKNYVIFSAKKLGLKRPMLDACWASFFCQMTSVIFGANYVHALVKTTWQLLNSPNEHWLSFPFYFDLSVRSGLLLTLGVSKRMQMATLKGLLYSYRLGG